MSPRAEPPEPSPRALARLRSGAPRPVGEAPPDEGGGGVGVDGGGGPSGLGGLRGWVQVPEGVAGARWRPSRRAVLGVALVLVLAAGVFAARVVWAGASSGGDPVAVGGGPSAGVERGAVPVGVPPGEASTASGSSVASTPSASGGAVVVVHVVGMVRRPGLQRLPPGSRVADAVAAAGGALRGADLAAVNLARPLVDGEQVRVPKPGEVLGPPGGSPVGGVGGGGGGGAGAAGAKVALNTADLSALDGLPGVGPVLAQRILDWRSEHGRFTSVDELGEVSGIGEKLLARLRPLVTT